MAVKTTPTSPPAWRPDVVAFPPEDTVDDAVIRQASTFVGVVEGDEPSVRCPYVADDGQPGFVAEGAEIPDADQQFAEVVFATNKVATIGKYSFETLQQPSAAGLIVNSLSRSIIASADAAFLSNDGDPAGILNNDGITDAGTVVDNLDPVVDAVAGIEANGGQATTIVAGPNAWATVAKLKVDASSAAPLLPAGNTATQRALLGIPVVVSAAMPADQMIVLDRSAVLSAQSQVRVARSEDAFFTSDTVAVRVAWRIGWAVMRPARVARLTATEG